MHKATGEPIIGAPVKLDGERFAVSSEQGVFHFDGVAPGWHRLSIDDPECAPFEIRFEVVAEKPTQLEFALDPRGKQDMEEMVIKSERLDLELSDTVLELDEVGKIPGTQGDVLKIVENLPGVARSSGAVGRGGGMGAMAAGTGYGIIVRGSAPEDSRVLIDDHEVPLLYHFGGLKSVLNSDILKRIDFLPGGFGAEYGMATGGIVDVRTRPCTHKQYDGYLELSMIDAGFLVKGPISEDAGFIAAVRRSTIDLWLPFVLEGIAGFEMTMAPTYYDYQLKLDWSPTDADRLSFFAFGSDDRMEFLLSKPPSGDPSLRGEFSIGQFFHRLHVSWVHASLLDWQVRLSLVGGYDSANISMGNASRYIRTDIPHLGLRADLEWQIAKRWKLKTGVQG
ncbi:MAG: TonB-dependent receptor, partial [Deltaproteobacteria bacterium]|nr:TonB-dependent receptor [Deltaproteobacteria bacterium]